MAPYDWDHCHNFHVPPNAIEAGHDTDGKPIYIGKTFLHGDELPVKIVPHRHEAYVSHGGNEIKVHQFSVLVRSHGHHGFGFHHHHHHDHIRWEHSSGGHVPHGAIPGGRTSSGEVLYIGRVNKGRGCAVGKVHPSHGTLYVPYDGREEAHQCYEVLVCH